MSEIAILFLGGIERPEFCDLRPALQSLGRVHCISRVEGAIKALETGEIVPDVIVIAQAFPQQFSHRDIDRLRRLAPLGRILVLLGSWCEGETRSGRPLPAAVRVYWHQWIAQGEREFKRLIQGQCPSWGLPVTATDEERLLMSTEQSPTLGHGLVAIHARSVEMADWLSAACRRRGYSTVLVRPPQYAPIGGVVAAIFDGSDLGGAELDQLRGLVACLGNVPVVVLLDFPRIEDKRSAIAAGAAAVLAKPFFLEDFDWQLDNVINVAGTLRVPSA